MREPRRRMWSDPELRDEYEATVWLLRRPPAIALMGQPGSGMIVQRDDDETPRTRGRPAARNGREYVAGCRPAPITHEDVWLRRVLASETGWPADRIPVTEPAYDDKEKAADLWVVPSDGSAPARRLTSSRGTESDVAWSEDGGRIVFATRREGDEVAQIYALDLVLGGEARRLTDAASGARSPVLSPDGRQLLYVSDIPDDPKAAETRYKARAYDGFPIRNWDHWRKPERPHLFILPLDAMGGPAGAPRDLLAGTRLAKSPGYAGRKTNSDDELDAVWSRDGGQIVFVASTNQDQAAFAFVDTQLYRVAASGGEPERITTGSDTWSRPRFSADGRRLFAKHERRTPKVYNIDHVAALGWPVTGAPQVLTAPLVVLWTTTRCHPMDARSGFSRKMGACEASTPTDRAAPRLAYPLENGSYSGLSMAAASSGPRAAVPKRRASIEVTRLDRRATMCG